VVDRGGTLASVVSQPPLTLRQLCDEDQELCSLCLVGSAAGPLAGDELSFQLQILDGARARLCATGASLAQGAEGEAAATVRFAVSVGSAAELVADPGVLIVTAGAQVEIDVDLDLAEDARVDWREMVVFGRSNEAGGSVALRWRVERAGRPLLVQHIDLTDDTLRHWGGMLGGQRVILTVLRAGPDLDDRTVVLSEYAVTQTVAAGATLSTVLAPNALEANRRMAELLSR
jgi:urease accessory protein